MAGPARGGSRPPRDERSGVAVGLTAACEGTEALACLLARRPGRLALGAGHLAAVEYDPWQERGFGP